MSFKSYHPKFTALLGQNPTIGIIAQKTYPFAHEAGVFIPSTNEVFITSNRLTDNDGTQRVELTKVKLGDDAQSTTCETVSCEQIVMANGGVNYRDGIIFCAQGGMDAPSGLYYYQYDPSATDPVEPDLLISDFHGRPFNSVNDIVVHSDGSIWFTDPAYGYEQGYRPPPRLPSLVYRFQPGDGSGTGSIRAMADGLGHPNGICFSPDEKVIYVTDTDWISGTGVTDDTKVSAIYAFDILTSPFTHNQPFLTSRRLFAMADTGVPDGIKCDTFGNVYSGCGDGVNVWNPGGVLIGKILVDGGIANFCFGREGCMVLLGEEKVWRVQLGGEVRGALLEI